MPAILTHQAWNSKPLMTAVTDDSTGMVKSIEYGLQSGVAYAPSMKLWTVNRISTTGPAVETRSSSYSYNDGLFVLSKQEFRGFKTVVQTDEQTEVTTTTTYDQSLIFQGRASAVLSQLHGATLSSATTTWAAKDLSDGKGTRHFAYPSKVRQVSHDLNGTLLSDNTTTSDSADYDIFGHLLTSTTSSLGGFSKTLVNTYSGTDTCTPIATTVTKSRQVKNGVPAYVLRSSNYRRFTRLANHRTRSIRLRAQRYLNIIHSRNWGYHFEYYQVPGTRADTTCWKVRQLVRADVTSTAPSDSKTRKSSFAYDANGFLKSETIEPGNAAWQQTSYTYDTVGNRTSTTVTGAGIASRTTTVAYDANGMFPISTTNALGHTETYAWDARFGKKTRLTGPNALTTSWQYDGFGRKIREDRADGSFTAIDLANAPASVTTTSSGSNPSTVWYDAMGRQIKSVSTGFDGTLIYNEVTYDHLGRKSAEYLPHTGTRGLSTTYTYDALNRPIKVTNANGDVASVRYNGLEITSTNAKGQSTTTLKNRQGKVIQVSDADGMNMSYAYDAFGNLTQTTDAAGNITGMRYDIRGRKIGMTDPDMGTWTYANDALGNLTRQTDAKHQSTSMLYDKLGRMTSRTEIEGTSRWTYDSKWIGALASESGGISNKSYNYDTFGRVKSSNTTINGQLYSVSTSYDNLGRVDTISYPTGVMIKRNYNSFHFMTSVSNVSTGTLLWQADTMDVFGHLTGESFGNGVTTTHRYDNIRGTLTGLQSTTNGTSIQNWNYDYDAVGNMKFRTDNVLGYTENFTYDNLNRLKTVKDAGFTLQKEYRYDAIGNITYKSDVGFYGYSPNHPHAVTSAGNNRYVYDANGNQASGAGRTLTWTSFNKPQGISTANGYTGFGYDANHNRISKTTPTSETIYIGKIFQRTSMNGISKDISHVYAGSKLIASIEDVAGLSSIKYMHGDHLGSISVITDEWGAVVERLRFDVFGLPVGPNTGAAKANIGASNTSRGYTGHEMDASTGLINMNARLYDPVLGRFISADTIVPGAGNMQQFNRYAYVLNNPLMYTDPSGHWSWKNFGKAVGQVAVIAAVAIASYFTAGYAMAAYSAAYAGSAAITFTGSVASFSALAGSTIGTAMVGGFVGGAIANSSMTAIAGGNLNQIASAGLMGGVAGAIGAGIGFQVGGATNAYFGKMVGQTANAGIQTGGDLRSMGRAFVMAGAAAAMRYIYKATVGYDVEWEGGDEAIEKGRMDSPVKDKINIGTVTRNIDPNSMWAEGGITSRAANYIPGINAVSGLHDQFQRGLEMAFGSAARDNLLLNVGGMGIAAGLTYSGLMANNPVLVSLTVNGSD